MTSRVAGSEMASRLTSGSCISGSLPDICRPVTPPSSGYGEDTVFPVVTYGTTPYFRAYPGTISLRVATYLRLVRDILDGLYGQGFRRIVVVNGHGGNAPAQTLVDEWFADHGDAQVKWHNWWNAPHVWAQVQATDPVASHASWMENFPWTRLEGVTQPESQKTPVDVAALRQRGPAAVRAGLGDGNFAGLYQRSDAEMQAIWDVAVAETRAIIEGPWALNVERRT